MYITVYVKSPIFIFYDNNQCFLNHYYSDNNKAISIVAKNINR